MEQIVVHIKDKEKTRVLFELLTSLDFVEFINASSTVAVGVKDEEAKRELADFFPWPVYGKEEI